MLDGRALQGGTSHYFGQNFTKPFDVKFQNREGKQEYAYQTSWGISTRLIGAVIMAHGDNRGLKLPPKVAPIQVVIVPVAANKAGVIEKATELEAKLKKCFRTKLDSREQYTPGYKFNYWEMKGVPVRIEIGPRDIENNQCIVVRRDTLEKSTISLNNIEEEITKLLEDIHTNMYNMAKEVREKRTNIAINMDEFTEKINANQGYIKTMWCGDLQCELDMKEKAGMSSRCIPFEQEQLSDVCACCGKPAKHMIYWGVAY